MLHATGILTVLTELATRIYAHKSTSLAATGKIKGPDLRPAP